MKIKRLLRVTVVFAVIVLLFYLYLPPREYTIKTMNATVGYNHVDVLCAGSSHMVRGINPIKMYRDKGYAAYLIWSGAQAPWQTYYYIKEACKKQSPRILLLDVYMFKNGEGDYQDYQTVSNMLDTPLSVSKLYAVKESVADSKLSILMRFPYIYDHYENFEGLSIEKLYAEPDYSMGCLVGNEVIPHYDVHDMSIVSEMEDLDPKTEMYLRRIIGYCKDRGTEVVLINAPCPTMTEEYQAKFNTLGVLAEGMGTTFIDGNMLVNQIGIDWETDCMDVGGHLNISGVNKFTEYIDSFLDKTYELPDRRGDNDYIAYDEGIKWITGMR